MRRLFSCLFLFDLLNQSLCILCKGAWINWSQSGKYSSGNLQRCLVPSVYSAEHNSANWTRKLRDLKRESYIIKRAVYQCHMTPEKSFFARTKMTRCFCSFKSHYSNNDWYYGRLTHALVHMHTQMWTAGTQTQLLPKWRDY